MPRKKANPKIHYKTAEDKAPDTQRLAYTVAEFCAAHRISLSMYYKMRAAGTGPREGRAGTKYIISFANAAAWLKKIEDVEVA